MGELSIWHWLVIVLPYLIPSIVAYARWHHNKVAISVLNILLGWTVIGWFAAFIWALTAKDPRLS